MPKAVYAAARAVDRKVKPGASAPAPRFGNFSPASAAPAGLPRFLQPKLAVSQPQEPAEQEADRVADQLMKTAAANPRPGENARRQQRARSESGTGEVAARFVSGLGPGMPLGSELRERWEPHLGQDLSDVRIHAGAAADRAAASVQARAFTLGRDVVFAAGEHDPGSERGRWLLAHELTHVVQQRGAASPPVVQRKEGDGNPPDPRPTLASRDEATDVVKIGAADFAIIKARTGTLKRAGGISGRYAKLPEPVGSSHGSVSWNYTITQAYENAQSDLEVTSGGGREHVETQVLPAVNILVEARGGAAAPAPASQASPQQARYEAARARFRQKMDELIVREEKGQVRQGEPPNAQAYFEAFAPGLSQFQNSVFIAHWSSRAEMLQYIDDAIALLRAKGDDRFADRVAELKTALVDEYQAARKRLADEPPRGAAGGFVGIQLVEVLGGLPKGGSSKLAFDRKAGPYTLHAIMGADVGNAVAYYSAYNRETKQTEYVVGFDAADAFIAKADYHAAYAAAFRLQHPNGMREYERKSYVALEQIGRGEIADGFWTLLGAHGEGLTDLHLMGETALALLGGIAVEGKVMESAASRGARGGTSKVLTSEAGAAEAGAMPKKVPVETPTPRTAPARPGETPAVKVEPPHPHAKEAERLIAKIEADGDPVVANIGGAGQPHEPQNAININNQAVGRKNIPNHINANGSEIGDILPPNSVQRVEGHRMPPEVVDWTRAAPGSYRVLKSGGTFRYSYQGANADAIKLAAELEKAGFKDVTNAKNVLVTATKP